MKDIIRKVLKEIFDQPYDWRRGGKSTPIQSDRPKSEKEYFERRHIYSFNTPKFKYIIHADQYGKNVYAVSFFVKPHKDFAGDKYSYQTKEGVPTKVIGTVLDVMSEIYKRNSKSSFVFFGAPDYEGGTIEKTKRYRVYKTMVSKMFGYSHEIDIFPEMSAISLTNKEQEKEDPELLEFIEKVLSDHL